MLVALTTHTESEMPQINLINMKRQNIERFSLKDIEFDVSGSVLLACAFASLACVGVRLIRKQSQD